MWVLGIDPGIASLGYSILTFNKGKLKLISWGIIKTSAKKSHKERLLYIFQSIQNLLTTYPKISQVITEEVYFNKKYSSALGVAQVNALIAVVTILKHKLLFSYSPQKIKKVVLGWGRAKKEQLRYILRLTLKDEDISYLPTHVIDSISVVLCHIKISHWKKLNSIS